MADLSIKPERRGTSSRSGVEHQTQMRAQTEG